MEKLTGYGIPHNHLEGQVGQQYEDLNTGNLYECRVANKFSATHGAPVGGYVWVLRATGEDISELYGSGGGSWNDLKDKPFYEETAVVAGDTLTWDGNTDGLESANFGFPVPYYRISENSIPFSEVDGVECAYVFNNEEKNFIPQILTDGVWWDEMGAFLVVTEPLDSGDTIVPVGVWTGKEDGGDDHLDSLTIPGYTGFETIGTVVKPIETKYLPEHLQFGEDKAFEPIVWDGNTEVLDIFTDADTALFKVSDEMTPNATGEGLASASLYLEHPETGSQNMPLYVFTADYGWGLECGPGFVFCTNGANGIPKGTWVMDFSALGVTDWSITINPGTTVKPLDEKYLPILTSPGGKKFKLSIADDGTITATEV